jgi:5-hydroxyisourate hydrolase-like protein (transthyretin family)
MRHPYCTVPLVITAVVLLTGCSTAQTFQLLVTVLNKADGKPLAGAKVSLDTLGVEERKLDLDYGWLNDAKTDDGGKFSYDLTN